MMIRKLLLGYLLVSCCSIHALSDEEWICRWLGANDVIYTLCGDKPVSFRVIGPQERLSFERLRPRLNGARHLAVLKKARGSQPVAFWIDRECFVRAVDEEEKLFSTLLGRDVSGESLLEEFLTQEQGLLQFLNNREDLLGILLGFGSRNARLFQRRTDLGDIGLVLQGRSLVQVPYKLALPASEFETLTDELAYFANRSLLHRTYDRAPALLRLPSFVQFEDDPANLQILESYRNTRATVGRLRRTLAWDQILDAAIKDQAHAWACKDE